MLTLSKTYIIPGIMKNIQNRGAPVNRAKPCIKHKIYKITYKLCVVQKKLYAFFRIVGCANTKIMHITINRRTPVIPIKKRFLH